MYHPVIESLEGGLIVSSQALENEIFFGSEYMVKFAMCAEQGKAVAIRANTPKDIAAIKKATSLPLIGLWKKDYEGSNVYITPTIMEVEGVIKAGADIIAIDATLTTRPDGRSLRSVINEIRTRHRILLMADVSTVEEGIEAEDIGFDLVSTTLSGYTGYSPQQTEPDYHLIEELCKRIKIPVIGEGRIQSPDQAVRCLQLGAYAVVVGGAITRPTMIVERFSGALTRYTKS